MNSEELEAMATSAERPPVMPTLTVSLVLASIISPLELSTSSPTRVMGTFRMVMLPT